MAISRVANISFTAAASTTTTVLKSAALFGSVNVGDRVYNTTRNKFSKVTVVTDASTITVTPSIASQASGDSVTITPAFRITGAHTTGTSTSIAATTLTDSGASWTVNTHASRIVMLTSGTYSGALGFISSNTATVLTIEQFFYLNLTTNAFEAVTPTGTPTYSLAYTAADIVAAYPADAVWKNATVARTLISAAGIILADATAFLTFQDITLELADCSAIQSTTNGSNLVFGRLNSNMVGGNGGEILFSHAENSFWDMPMYGKMWFLGVTVKIAKPLTVTNYPRWNAALTSGTDGIIIVNGTLKYGQILHQSDDVITGTIMENQNIAMRSPGLVASGLRFINANASIAGKHGVPGMQGGDIVGFSFSGSGVAGAGQRYLWGDTSILPYAVAYIHGFDMGDRYPIVSDWFDLFSWSASMQYNHYYTIPVTLGTKKASDNSSLGTVAIGVVTTSDGAGQIITAKGGTLDTTLTVGTTTTTLKASGGGFTDISVGDWCYNLTRQTTLEVLTKPDNDTITTAVSTGQVSGDLVNFKSRSPYAPTKNRFVTTDGSGDYASPLGNGLGLVVAKYRLSNGSARFNSTVATYSPYTIYALKYGYVAQSAPRDWTMNMSNAETLSLVANAYVVASEATARAYTGISVDGVTKVITVPGDRAIQELYDYTQVWRYDEAVNNDVIYDEPLSTSDGTTFTLFSGWSIEVSGSLIGLDKIISGTVGVTGSGFFEHLNGAVWISGADTYYASHAYVQAVDGITTSPIQYVALGWGDLPTQTQLLYNTSLALTGLETDVNGKAEGYFVYKINATTYANTKMVLGEYNYQFLTVPRTLTGAPIGSPSSYEVNRLSTDAQVTLSKAAALAITGITVTHASKLVDGSDEILSNMYDNLKARQGSIADIETGIPGCASYCIYGLLLTKSGTNFTAIDDWSYSNVGDTGKFYDGKIIFDVPGIMVGDYESVNFEFSVAGTYDFRSTSIIGTSILTNTSGSPVTVQLYPGTLYTNTGPNITVQATISANITMPNLIDGTRVMIYNVTQDFEIDNSVVSGGSGYIFAANLGTGFDAEIGDTILFRATYADASTAKEELSNAGVITASGVAFFDVQVDDDVYSSWAINGFLVTEFSSDYPNLQMDISDPDGRTQKKRAAAWMKCEVTTEDGIRNFFGAIETPSVAEIIVRTAKVNLQIENISALEVYFDDLDVRMYRDDLGQLIASGSYSVFLDYAGIPSVVQVGSGLSTDEHNQLMDALTVNKFIGLK
jgi:hypothetical protein